MNKNINKIIVTGSAGFIGFALCKKLLNRGDNVIGIDNHNDYYDPSLKEARRRLLEENNNYQHYKTDLSDQYGLEKIFKNYKPKKVVNLAAQAGVRYSMENPLAYINSNIVGFAHILENCRHYKIEHLVYASTSSVYGANTKMPFSESDCVNHPLSVYAASKKSNELMAHTYSHLYKLPTTGLRFFTVYGPWGRPDMALFKFTKNILKDEPIDVFNNGKHTRDFTYIDDIVEGVIKTLDSPPSINIKWNSKKPNPATSNAPWNIYNIGNNKPVELMDYIKALEKALGKKAIINFLPLQPGDVPDTYASVDSLREKFNYKPMTSVENGVSNFVKWYKDFYKNDYQK
ncbi:NAD-dependent epimerase [Candidatus Pelagibacter sp.]|nr:NAD-dependent epimerase [Candidatus Pelagibacter sp.]|tara:strand:- start:626 stop:1660 length:1035 start_codon:yes stop_codon:yes gene_type:complete